MKKAYVQPEAKKVVFNYAEAVTAAQSGCQWGGNFTDDYRGCYDTNIPMGGSTRVACDWITPKD